MRRRLFPATRGTTTGSSLVTATEGGSGMATERAGAPQKVSEKDVAQKIFQFVLHQMRSGADKQAIAAKLAEMGVDPVDSRQVVETVHAEVMKAAEAQQVTSTSMISGILGGGIAAVVAGFLWALIVRFTDYEIGFMAWGLGLLVGAAVVVFAGGRRGRALQMVAVLASIGGILVAKYFIFVHFLRQAVLQQYGAEQAASVTLFSTRILGFFFKAITTVLSGYDAIWVILAVLTAWRLPQGLGIRVPKRERGMIV